MLTNPGARRMRAVGRALRACGRPFPILVVLGMCWALATPVYAVPDEPSQVVKAAAVSHGQLVGARVAGPYTAVQAPAGVVSTTYTCFVYQITTPASCARPLPGDHTLVTTTTYSGRYLPLYYLLVGWPSRWLAGDPAVYARRSITVVLVALLLAGAFKSAAASRRSRLLLPALGVVVTPYVLYLAGAVNPSGPEMGAALCAWTSGLVLLGEPPGESRRRLVIRMALALIVLSQMRGLGLLLVAFVLATLALLEGPRAMAAVARTTAGKVLGVSLVASACFALVWLKTVGGLDLLGGQFLPGYSSISTVMYQSSLRYGRDLVQMVGMFGWWQGTYLPRGVYIVWFAMAIGIVLAALVTTRGRRRGVVAIVAVASAAVPVLLVAHEQGRSGIVGQGRYWFPLTAGAILLAAHQALPRRERTVQTAVAVGALIVLALQVAAFRYALDRYRFGVGGIRGARAWEPPAGALVLTGVYVVAIVGLCALWWHQRPTSEVRARGRWLARAGLATATAAVATAVSGVPALAAAPVTYRWTGPDGGTWSGPSNWLPAATGAATSSAALVFPGPATCGAAPCRVVDDLPAAQARAISVQTGPGGGYDLEPGRAGPVEVGPGGVTTQGPGSARLGLDLSPVGDQQWHLGAAVTDLAGGAYGIDALTLMPDPGTRLLISDNIDVGDVVVAGRGRTPDETVVTLEGVDLDGAGTNPVAISDAELAGSGQLGPVTTSEARISVGDEARPGTMTSTGDVALDRRTTVTFASLGGPAGAVQSFSQLDVAGVVSINSSVLRLEASCATPPGSGFPIIRGNAVAGAFTRPDGSAVLNGGQVAAAGPGGCIRSFRIFYGPQSVTAVAGAG